MNGSADFIINKLVVVHATREDRCAVGPCSVALLVTPEYERQMIKWWFF
jgi:hypothetical protein